MLAFYEIMKTPLENSNFLNSLSKVVENPEKNFWIHAWEMCLIFIFYLLGFSSISSSHRHILLEGNFIDVLVDHIWKFSILYNWMTFILTVTPYKCSFL